MSSLPTDRRSEARFAARGTVLLRTGAAPHTLIKSCLIEISERGARLTYEGPQLSPGDMVELQFRWGMLPAQIMWISVVQGSVTMGVNFCERAASRS